MFKNADGAKSDVEKKLAKDIRKWQDAGHAFTYMVFANMGHGALAGEHTEQFVEEIKAEHAASLKKQAVVSDHRD